MIKLHALFFLGAFSPSLFFTQPAFAVGTEGATVCFKQTCFRSEIAKTSEEKKAGLMNHSALSENSGMLFVYEKEWKPVFWMKNMQISLDFVWLNAKLQIVNMHENVSPCTTEKCVTLESPIPVQYVLEIPTGSIQKNKIKLGDKATIEWGET